MRQRAEVEADLALLSTLNFGLHSRFQPRKRLRMAMVLHALIEGETEAFKQPLIDVPPRGLPVGGAFRSLTRAICTAVRTATMRATVTSLARDNATGSALAETLAPHTTGVELRTGTTPKGSELWSQRPSVRPEHRLGRRRRHRHLRRKDLRLLQRRLPTQDGGSRPWRQPTRTPAPVVRVIVAVGATSACARNR